MRNKIIEMLKNADGGFISGEDIAAKLDVSRTAIWKHIRKLRATGYDIISKENRGYSLKELPDLLLPENILPELNTKIIAADNSRVIYLECTESTNKTAKKIAAEGAVEGTVIIAEEQTGGKGRLERDFFSPKRKGILFSLILRPNCLPKDAPKFTLLAAVALVKAMEKFNLNAKIKWPNDIIFDGRKVVGILTEMSAEIGRVNYIVIGIGINANISREEFPENIRDIAASLYEMNGNKKISRVNIFRAILEELDKIYCEINSDGFEKIFKLWREYNATLGRDVKVISAESGEIFFGKAIDIDEEGALIVEVDGEQKKVFAGDVSIRNVNYNDKP